MSKDYQTTARTNTTVQSPMPVPPVVVPDAVSVAISEIAADGPQGLLAIAVAAGLQLMAAPRPARRASPAVTGAQGPAPADRREPRTGDRSTVLPSPASDLSPYSAPGHT